MSRNRLWSIVGTFIVAALIIEAWSQLAAVLFVMVGAGLGISLTLKNRPTSRSFPISTDCQRCGAALRSHVGFPERTCSQCGQRQSWSR